MHPNTTKRTNTWVKIPMRGFGCVNCEKFRCDFMAQTCALIAPFQPVLHRVLSINETLPNATKHYETHQNRSLGFNWVDQVCSFWKILTGLHGTNLCINSTISARKCIEFRAVMKQFKCTPILWNARNHDFRVQWGGLGAFVAKNFWCNIIAQTCPLIAPVQPILHRVSCSN